MFDMKKLPPEVHKLREVRDCGYETRDVLQLLSNMSAELHSLEECWQLKSWNKEYTLRTLPQNKAPRRPCRGL